MPIAAIGVGLGTAIAGAGAATATVVGSKMSANAARRAGDIQAQTASKAYDYERERDRIEQEQYDREYARKVLLEDEQRRWHDEDRQRQARMDEAQLGLSRDRQNWTFGERAAQLERLAPYAHFGQQGMRKLSQLL